MVIKLTWKKYLNFFDLWRAHIDAVKLVYVIGEAHHCYIGSIGSKNGQGGLKTRYVWQYVDRARAIFRLEENQGQPAFAGLFDDPKAPSGNVIRVVEASIQNSFIRLYGEQNALFHPLHLYEMEMQVQHLGNMPLFLKQSA